MKRLSLILTIILLCCLSYSQTPDGFNYQAVATDANGNPVVNTTLPVKIGILSDTILNTYVWEEEHNVTTNGVGLFSLVIGSGTRVQGVASFADINWSDAPLFIRTKVTYKSAERIMGSAKLWSVPYAKVADMANSVSSGSKLSVVSSDDSSEEALFEVKRQDGQTVFAVYPEAVNIYVPRSGSKANKGGFAIGGFGQSKLSQQDYFRVTPDSVRVYIDPTPAAAKGSKGGFAIGGYGEAKGINDMYFNLSGASSVNTVAESPQILWYPIKKAFLAGSIHIGAVDSVGQNSTALGYRSIAMGNFSQAFGYKAKAFGDYSTSIGKNSVAGARSGGVSTASSAFALGNAARATGDDSYAFGSLAEATGVRSFAFGSVGINESGTPTGIPTKASGNYSLAIGMGAQSSNTGTMALGTNAVSSGFSGVSIGSGSLASNTNSLALGNGAKSTGVNATSIGYQPQANGEMSISLGSYYSYSYTLLPYFTPTKGSEGDSKGDFIIRPPILYPVFRTITFNRANIANGKYSISIGNGNLSENGGMALGSNNDAVGFGAVAVGVSNRAINTNSFAAGFSNLSTGFYSTTFGNNTYSKAYGSFVIGQYNIIAGDSTKWVETDPLFIIGNGLNSTDRSNALTIYKNGRTILQGADANTSINDRVLRFMYNPFTHLFSTTLSVYGIKSFVNRVNTDVDYFYSGYFYNTGTAGVYNGLYADTRTGDGFDVAEYYYDTEANTEPGDVVIADINHKESVVKSNKPYQTSTVGVISTQPHMTMGLDLIINQENGEAVPGVTGTRLALNGRVPVKVSDENGPILPGDLLTTSSTPGYAMKWSLIDVNGAKDFGELKAIIAENEKRRNAIIGKAVESFSGSGTGKIMVLISLQ